VGAVGERAGEQLSVLDEVLLGHVRRRRRRRAVSTVLLLLAMFAGLWFTWPRPAPAGVDRVPNVVPWTAETGAVTGYIQPCSGIGLPADARPAGGRLVSAAALVEALPGQQHEVTAADGTYRVVLPAVVAARERVARNEAFRLDDLAPGRYVILAQYAGGTASTYAQVWIMPGQVVMIDLPNTCK
jgi:hypothetical protein